jgi:hypothetical protein
MRGDALHWGVMTGRMSPEQFLRDVGPFVFAVTLDGRTWTYPFSIAKLEQQIETTRRQLQTQLTGHFSPEIERVAARTSRLLKFRFSQLYPAFETGSVVLVERH